MKHNSLYTLTLAFIVCFGTQLNAQNCIDITQLGTSNVQCVNIDLNYDDATGLFGWGAQLCSQYDHPRHTLITQNDFDDLCPMIQTLPPNGTASVELASDGYGPYDYMAKGEAIFFRYNVTEDNYIAILKYAAALEVPQHEISQYAEFWSYAQPWINIYLADPSGAVMEGSFTQQAFSAIETVADWSVYNAGRVPIIYHDWMSIPYDLSDYIGQTVTIVVELYDCAEQDAGYDEYGNFIINTCDDHHTGHIYCTVDCAEIEEEQNCEKRTTTLTIPEGFTTIEWYDGTGTQLLGTNRSITLPLPNPDEYGYYLCHLLTSPNDLEYILEITITDDCGHECLDPGELTLVNRICDGQSKAVLSAPQNRDIVGYRWYEQYSPFTTLGTSANITIEVPFDGGGYCCEMTYKDTHCDPITKTIYVPACQGGDAAITTPNTVCADADAMYFYAKITGATSPNYDLVFDDAASRAGFQNVYGGYISPDGTFKVPMPHGATREAYAQPNIYSATLTVHPGFGHDTIVPFNFSVLYPSWIVRQQWNDVLAVLNKEYNGGYDFTHVRWFKGEGEEILGRGAHSAYIYTGPDAELDFGVQYWAELTRTSDGRAICSCPLIPIHNNAAPKKVEEKEKVRLAPLFPNNTHNVKISSEISGDYIVYTISGMQIATGKFGPTYGKESIILTMPGTYIIEFIGNEGTVETRKWLVE